jgi:hypothetical protein
VHPRGDRQVAPREVRGEAQDALGDVDHPGRADADGEDIGREEALRRLDHRGEGRRLVLGGRDELGAPADGALAAHPHGEDLRAADIDADRLAAVPHRPQPRDLEPQQRADAAERRHGFVVHDRLHATALPVRLGDGGLDDVRDLAHRLAAGG